MPVTPNPIQAQTQQTRRPSTSAETVLNMWGWMTWAFAVTVVTAGTMPTAKTLGLACMTYLEAIKAKPYLLLNLSNSVFGNSDISTPTPLQASTPTTDHSLSQNSDPSVTHSPSVALSRKPKPKKGNSQIVYGLKILNINYQSIKSTNTKTQNPNGTHRNRNKRVELGR